MIYLIVAIIIFLIFLIICLICKQNKKNKRLGLETFSTSTNKKVVIFKTHIWNDEIEVFTSKILAETSKNNIDFYILIHDEDGSLYNKIPQFAKKYTLFFKQNEISTIYKTGFINMWLSNHWILMWFFNLTNRKYDYYWSIEYDVRITGNSEYLWDLPDEYDFIYPVEPFLDSNWAWKNYYYGKLFTDETKWYGYLQLARYSKRFLEWLDKFYTDGENGQDEMITFSLFKIGEAMMNFTGTHTILGNLIKNSWSVVVEDSDKNRSIMKTFEELNQVAILHPIK